MMMALCAMTFTSCSDESELIPAVNTPLTFRVNITSDSNTRALKQAWENGDQIILFLDNLSATVFNYLTLTYEASGNRWKVECPMSLDEYLRQQAGTFEHDCIGVWCESDVDFTNCTFDESEGAWIIPEGNRPMNQIDYFSSQYTVSEDNVVSLNLYQNHDFTRIRIYNMPEELMDHRFTLAFDEEVYPIWLAGIRIQADYTYEHLVYSPGNEHAVACEFSDGDLYCFYKTAQYEDVNVVILNDLDTGKSYRFRMPGSRQPWAGGAVRMSFSNFKEISDKLVIDPEGNLNPEFGPFYYWEDDDNIVIGEEHVWE